ncbi:MAG: UvrD-helicase domain-containing protein [Planctomycetia bacterium]|nr:UvrD-helicase domain-containing protein [Planctomycetia bacterium]
MSLNASQREAVETLSGPLLVLAGAGTGKTRVVTYRIARLIKSGIAPERILAVTFTNKAAREMLERVSALLPKRADSKRPEISTFHSHCVRILRRNIHHLGYPNLFTIYDRGDQESIARQVLQSVKVANGAIKPGDFLKQVGAWKSAGIRPSTAQETAQSSKDYLCALAYGSYQRRLRDLGAVDFDDILLLTEDLFKEYPETLVAESELFDHILIDEYQDTNMSQYRIVRGLATPHRNLCVVGDDDQAIYGWRGAQVQHILNFQKDWPDAKVVRLEDNYRSTSEILTWANRLIDFNRTRHAKHLRSPLAGVRPRIIQCADGEEEASRVVGSIKERIDVGKCNPRDFAILFRTNQQPRAFEMQMREQNIPYTVVGGQSFFDRKEIKDVISWLNVLIRPQNDVALLRIINCPPRHIGSTTLGKFREYAVKNGRPVWDALNSKSEVFATLDAKTQDAVGNFRSLVQRQAARFRASFTPDSILELLEASRYQDEIDRMYSDPEERKARRRSVEEVVEAAGYYLKEHPGASLRDFLDDTSLGGADFASQQDKRSEENAVMLTTYHAAKGLEFKEVYMVGMEEGLLPHSHSLEDMTEQAVEEERRLCYVGVTRAQERLTLSFAVSRMKYGKMRPTIPSRFLYEATGQADNPRYLQVKEGMYLKQKDKNKGGRSH